jgi:hypothetical protein
MNQQTQSTPRTIKLQFVGALVCASCAYRQYFAGGDSVVTILLLVITAGIASVGAFQWTRHRGFFRAPKP